MLYPHQGILCRPYKKEVKLYLLIGKDILNEKIQATK